LPTNHVLTTDETRHTSERLLASLQQWRDAGPATSPDAIVPGHRAIAANRAVIEQAKGALMMRFGIDSYQAFAVMVRWSRVTRVPVPTIAHTLLHGICEGNPQIESRQRPLMRWLEDQLRHDDAELV